MPAEDDNSKLPDALPDNLGTPEPHPQDLNTSASRDLPNLDFSLPTLPEIDPNAVVGNNTSSNALPADLILPTFPELDSAAWLAGLAEQAEPPTEAATVVTPAPEQTDPPAEATTVVAKAPEYPSVSTPPPVSLSQHPGMPTGEQIASFFSAPDTELPKLSITSSVKPNLTLLGIATAQPAPSRMPMARWLLLGGIAALVVVAALIGWMRESLVSFWLGQPQATHEAEPHEPTKHEQALKSFAQGTAAYQVKDYAKALLLFDKTLQLEEHFADAHRSLGIVYAVLHEQDKAVLHYKLYLAEKPEAQDKAAVQKIITDYEQDPKRAVPPAAAPKPVEPVAEEKKPSKKHRASKSAHKKHHRH